MKSAVVACLLLLTVSSAYADPLTCTLTGYRAAPGPCGQTSSSAGRATCAACGWRLARVLKAFGLDAATVRLETIGFQEAATRLLDGTLDAMFDNAINQSDSLSRAIAGGAGLVAIEGSAVENLRREYPFLKLTVISPALYPGLLESVHTIGIDGVLICRSDLDERLVYNLTKQLFVSLEALSEHGALRSMEIDRAPATPIPLHDGAARYYRERELSR